MFEMYYLKFKILCIPFWKNRVIYYKIWGFLGGGVIIVILLFHFFFICDKKMCF